MNNSLFIKLREEYKTFRYVSFDYSIDSNKLNIKYHFCIDGLSDFYPEWTFDILNLKEYDQLKLENLIFNLGLIELISYWKITCSKDVYIEPDYMLDDNQISFFKKLYFNGLGEFFYRNDINVDFDSFMSIHAKNKHYKLNDSDIQEPNKSTKCFVTIGGGKDSVTALEIVKNDVDVYPFIINPSGSKVDCLNVSSLKDKATFAYRILDKNMLDLNSKGFLNGHTPFSALVAFASTLSAYLNDINYIVLSNEASANEPTVLNTNINHQYSKSYEFELDFYNYEKTYLKSNSYYFSILRPLLETTIAKLFSKYDRYFKAFKSCNVGQKENVWCGHCPKCLFVYIILSPYLEQSLLEDIFGKNLLNDMSLKEDFDKLVGFENEKPFECVGQRNEIINSLNILVNKGLDLSLINYYKNNVQDYSVLDLNNHFDSNHNIPLYFEKLLRKALYE